MRDVFFSAMSYSGDFIRTYKDEILAIGTIFIALFTAGLIIISRRQIILTRILQRAYVAVEPRGVEQYRTLDGRLSCDVAFINAGNLPAQNVSWFIDRDFSPDIERAEFPIPSNKFSGNNLIPPKGAITKGGPAINHTDYDAFVAQHASKPDQSWLYVWGRVRYKDGFGRNRFTDFCYRYSLRTGPNNWSIDQKHGRQHEHGNRTDEG